MGRTALVTGAGRGIGLEIAKELASLGATVLLLGRNADRLSALERDINEAGNKAVAMPADVCDPRCLDAIKLNLYSVDIFVHGAASFAPYGPLEQRTEQEIATVLDTNLGAALRISAALLPGMKQRNYGMLIFLGSKAATLGAMNQVIYASAKAGLDGLVKSLAVENSHSGINAHLIELGLIDTERTREAMTETARDKLVSRTPSGRAGTPEDVAAAVRYLVSPQATFLRGITLPVSGGMGLGVIPPHKKTRSKDVIE